VTEQRKGIHFTPRQGEAHWQARLNEKKVRAIRKAARDGVATAVLAKRYGVGAAAIRKVVRRESWGHVEDEG
jgi:transposase-like protein